MKNKLITIVIFAFILFSFTENNILSDYSGKWQSESANSSFELNLIQTNEKVRGSHCSVQLNGNRIDCFFEDTDITIFGDADNSDSIRVTFISQISQKSGIAKIKRLNTTSIEWEILTKPQGEFYLPNKIILTKQ
ncbi:MAG: hypothetical protein WBH12_06785 [Sediminibacterium sp.]